MHSCRDAPPTTSLDVARLIASAGHVLQQAVTDGLVSPDHALGTRLVSNLLFAARKQDEYIERFVQQGAAELEQPAAPEQPPAPERQGPQQPEVAQQLPPAEQQQLEAEGNLVVPGRCIAALCMTAASCQRTFALLGAQMPQGWPHQPASSRSACTLC